MKKKIIVILLFFLILTLKEVNATPLSNFLPGGKNYIDEANMLISGNSMMFEDDIRVKPNTVYTLTLPGFDIIGTNMYIELSGEENYILGNIDDLTNCTNDPDIIICQITTTETETELYFEFYASMIDLYYDNYGLEYFQLEEGSVSTEYEVYIPPYIDTTNPEFNGIGAYVKSYQTNESISYIIENYIMAYDDIDGDLSNQIEIISDDYSGNEEIIGEYDVLLYVSDSAGNEAFFTLTILVKDEIAPIITGPDILDVSVEEVTILQNLIINNFSMVDEYDDTLDINILTDEYTDNKSSLGEYNVSFEVFDDSLNSDSKAFIIRVVDITAPQMVGENLYNSYLSNSLLLEDILGQLSFTDNYTDLSSVEPTILVDNFSSNELIPGTYNIDIQIMDSSNNILSETIIINVIDDVEPSITGPTDYSGSYDVAPTVEDFIAMFTVNDNIDTLSTDDIYIISDNYSTRTTEIGSFIISFGLLDTNNNEYIHNLNVILFDGVAPVIYVDNYVVTVNLSATFNENDALKLLLNSNELENGNYVVTRLLDEYTGNEKTPGAYIYRLSFKNDEGEVFEKEFLVKVTETSTINLQKDLIQRNIAVYSSALGFAIFIFIKKRK